MVGSGSDFNLGFFLTVKMSGDGLIFISWSSDGLIFTSWSSDGLVFLFRGLIIN